MNRREELLTLTGQALNGMLSADSTFLSKLVDRTVHNKIAHIAVSIAEEALEKIDNIEKSENGTE